jgi:hypothetical protein
MDLIPDAGQISQVMSQATGPAFVLGAVAAFIAVLLSRVNVVIDRIRSLNEIADNDTRAHLKSDIPRTPSDRQCWQPEPWPMQDQRPVYRRAAGLPRSMGARL